MVNSNPNNLWVFCYIKQKYQIFLVPHIYKCIYLYRTLDGELEMKIETLEKKMEEMSATISELQEQISALYGKMMFLILLQFQKIYV